MKTLYVFLLFLFSLSITFSQWIRQNPIPTGQDLESVVLVSPNIGWTVGDLGTILKTTDGGTNWLQQSSGIINRLYEVYFTDTDNGITVGDAGTILKTTDGGTNWDPQSGGTTATLLSVFLIDADNGIIVGDNGLILKTTNGGTNWVQQSSGTTAILFMISFTDDYNGTIVGRSGTILRTTDGGTNWVQQNSGTTLELFGVSFVDPNNGWVVGEGGIILHTTNAGLNWTQEIIDCECGLYNVSFSDINNGTVISSSGGILRTTNGGIDWAWQSSGTTSELFGMFFTDIDNGIIVGKVGLVIKTTDGGTSWIPQSGGTLTNLNGVCFSDDNNGWIVGQDVILRTTNSGTNWVNQYQSEMTTFFDVQFLDNNNGWIVGNNGVTNTTDGGENWTSQLTGLFFGICFIDIENGWICGNEGSIFRTTNGGANWDQQSSGTTNILNAISFVDLNNGAAVGRSGKILKTSNGGVNWIQQASGITYTLHDIKFINTEAGLAVGEGGNILSTSNGGVSWIGQTVDDIWYTSISWLDMSTIRISGFDYGTNMNLIKETINGGTTWTSATVGTDFITDLYFTDANHGTAVGALGSIFGYNSSSSNLTLIDPNGGQWWKTGWNREITWSSENVSNVNLYYSSDNGNNWIPIASNLTAATGIYEWEIPLLNYFIEENCKVKIEDASNSANYDVSDNPFNIWHPWGVEKTCNLGQQIVDFLETNVDISLEVTTAGDITVTYYPGEAAVLGTLPTGIVVISDYYWHAATPGASFNNGKMIIPISTLRGVTDPTKLVWLKRSNSGDPWENIGGIVSGENLESIVSFNSFSEFAIGSTDPANPLPVELSSFIAISKPDQVILKWETKTETNNYGFDIERKVSDQWQKIGFINGNGNSNSPKEYSFSDKSPIGGSKFQYRLKQIDNNGQFEYSKAVEVELVLNEYSLYQNYPNPFNPTTKIRYQLPIESKVVIKVYNILGSEITELLNEQKEAGIYEVEFNAETLSSGTYIYKISADNFIQTKKMILLK